MRSQQVLTNWTAWLRLPTIDPQEILLRWAAVLDNPCSRQEVSLLVYLLTYLSPRLSPSASGSPGQFARPAKRVRSGQLLEDPLHILGGIGAHGLRAGIAAHPQGERGRAGSFVVWPLDDGDG